MTIKELIEDKIRSHKVVVYMKGTPEAPQCGFSKAVIDILSHYQVDYTTVNVLEDDQIRQGIKDFTQWPTIPQVFINGEFIGGCDIMLKMHNDNELNKALAG